MNWSQGSKQGGRYFGVQQSWSNVSDNDAPGGNLPLKRRRRSGHMLRQSFPVSAQWPRLVWDNTTLSKFTPHASKYIKYTVYFTEANWQKYPNWDTASVSPGCLNSYWGDKPFPTSHREMSFNPLKASSLSNRSLQSAILASVSDGFFFGRKMLLQEIICFLFAIHPSAGPSHAQQRQSLRASFFCRH